MREAQRVSHIQRVKLGEMGIKKRGFKKLSNDCKEILKTLDEHGPLTRSRIMGLTKIPSGTIDRRLWLLKELECVKKRGRKYLRSSDIVIYENKTDRDLALEHSKNIASGLLFLISSGARYKVTEETLMLKPEYKDHALKHLRTAPEYSEIYSIFEEAEKAKDEAHEEMSTIRERIKAKFLHIRLKLIDKSNLREIIARGVYEDIRSTLKELEPTFLSNLKVEDGYAKSGMYTLANAEEFEPLKRFIVKEEKSEENRNACERILKLEDRYYNFRQDFGKHVEQLIMQALNGTPLKGKCDICPKVITENRRP